MNIWHDINPERISPKDFIAVVEIQKGSKTKYELDKETGMLVLDRILSTSTHYPANYGFIPRTYADDGDPLDILILCSEPITPMTLVRCYPIGVFTMLDNGKKDRKIIAIPFSDRIYNVYSDDLEFPKDIVHGKIRFVLVYTVRVGMGREVAEVEGHEEAILAITSEIARYNDAFCK